MESQPHNPEFRINPENFHPCYWLTMLFFVCCLLLFFQNQLFQKTLSGIPSECQTVWILIRSDVCLIWVQTVCKGYHKTTPVNTLTAIQITKVIYCVVCCCILEILNQPEPTSDCSIWKCLFCVHVCIQVVILNPSQQFFSHVGTFSCNSGLKLY